MSKFLGFLLGVAVALAGPAVFGVLAAPGGIELNAKGMALAFGIGALIFWTVVSYFSGAGALGAFAAFGTLIYCWLWIPNRTTNFLNDVPGVTTGMIEGSKQYTLNGVVPILTVISLVYAIQLIVQSVQRRRRERAEAERLQREQEAAQAQQEAEAAALYPVAGSTYAAEGGGYAGSFGNSNRYDDLFDEDPEPVRPRSQADEQTSQFPVSAPEQTAQFPGPDAADDDAQGNDYSDDTVLVPTDRDETTQVPVETDETVQAQTAPPQPAAEEQPTVAAEQKPTPQEQPTAKPDDEQTVAAPVATAGQPTAEPDDEQTVVAPVGADQPTVAAPVAADEQSTVAAPVEPAAAAPVETEQPTVVAEKPDEPRQEKKDADGGQQAMVAAPVTYSKDQAAPVVDAKEQVAPTKAAAPAAQEQMGQQYRERMEDPEDTGEFFISAFENPNQVSIRPAGA